MSPEPGHGDSWDFAGLNIRVIGVYSGRVRLRIYEQPEGPSRVRRVSGELNIPLESYWRLDTAAQRESDADR